MEDHIKNSSEIARYLKYQTENDIENLEQLNLFPMVRELYKKYNVIMPSEADVERLFSYAGICILSFILKFRIISLFFFYRVDFESSQKTYETWNLRKNHCFNDKLLP